MTVLSEHDVFIFIAQLGVILLLARIFGDLAIRFKQPIIVGELFAGIILGPSIFGRFFPQGYESLFPATGYHSHLLQGISWLCVLFLLLITGLELDFRASIRQGKQCFLISLFGLVFAFLAVYSIETFLPLHLYPAGVDPNHVNLFIAVALSVAAIPVIAKILFDLKILRSEVGVKILTSGVLSDVWGWTLLAVTISLISTGAITLTSILKPIFTMAIYLWVTLAVGRKIIDKCLNFIGYKKMDTTVVLSLLFSLTLLNGAIAHLLGIHVIFGGFIAGIMAGESEKITPYVRQWTQDFIFAVFAPIFFVLVGMQINFMGSGIWVPSMILLIVSSIFKIGGAFLGGVMGGLGRKNAFTVACGLNTQGTMGIVVALIAFEMGVFNLEVFSVVVIVCVSTSLLVGPLLKWAIRGVRRPLAKYFDAEHIFLGVEGTTKTEVISQLAGLMKDRNIIQDEERIQKAIWDRENVMSTAIGEGVALPHARLKKLKSPILCFFRLKNPIDFSSPDNKPVQLLFLELTDRNDDGMQLNLISQVARFVSVERNRQRLLNCSKENEVHNILTFDEHA